MIQFSSKQRCFLHALPTWAHGRVLCPLQPQVPLPRSKSWKRRKVLFISPQVYTEGFQRFWSCIQHTIHWDKAQILKKIPFGQNKRYKKLPSFFFREIQLITVLLLICNSYMSWSTRFLSLKLRVRFSIFYSISFLLKFIILFIEMHELFDCKTSQFHLKLKQ